jgi:DmsE family decaheme c-type cytochrome
MTAVTSGDEGGKTGECAECHEDVVKAFAGTFHGVMKAACTDCHGDGAKHIEEGGAEGTIVGFKKESALVKTKHCLKCHRGAAHFMSGPHAKASLDCTGCHGVHKSKYMAHPSKLCISCHQDVFAEFKLNERHRLKEGILECTSCHDPHGPAIAARLGGFKHEACLKCHTDKGGPFLYEHEASRIEGCAVCHEVHGSPNRHMLKHQNVVELCFSCHVGAPSWHQRFTTGPGNCVSCHSTIHGSNLDKIFLK